MALNVEAGSPYLRLALLDERGIPAAATELARSFVPDHIVGWGLRLHHLNYTALTMATLSPDV